MQLLFAFGAYRHANVNPQPYEYRHYAYAVQTVRQQAAKESTVWCCCCGILNPVSHCISNKSPQRYHLITVKKNTRNKWHKVIKN